jgi:16S rRNA (guanine527-N7)-methyltransferase
MAAIENLKKALATMGLSVPDEALSDLVWLLEELLRWNKKINLTAITEPAEALEKHLLDSLTPLPWLSGVERLLDMGSGAGFPGLPLKLARPDLKVVSLDSHQKKIGFQQHVVRCLKLNDFTAKAWRLEDAAGIATMAGQFDVAVARALTALDRLMDMSRPFLAKNGLLLAMKGSEGEAELQQAASKIEKEGWRVERLIKLRLPHSGAARTLIWLRGS